MVAPISIFDQATSAKPSNSSEPQSGEGPSVSGNEGESWLEAFMAAERASAGSGACKSTGQGYSVNHDDCTITMYGSPGSKGTKVPMTDEAMRAYRCGPYSESRSSVVSDGPNPSTQLNQLSSGQKQS